MTSIREVLDRSVELLAAAPDEPRRWIGDDDGIAGGDEPSRLVGHGAVDEYEPGLDLAWASVRLTARPRRTSSASSRRRATTQPADEDAAAFLAPAFFAGARFFAADFLAGAFFARKPSWRRPSWLPPCAWPEPSWRRRPGRRLLRRCSSPPTGRPLPGLAHPRDEALELVLDVVDPIGQPTELPRDLGLHRIADLRGHLPATLEQRLHRRVGVGSVHRAGLDQALTASSSCLRESSVSWMLLSSSCFSGFVGIGACYRRPSSLDSSTSTTAARSAASMCTGTSTACLATSRRTHERERAAERDGQCAVSARAGRRRRASRRGARRRGADRSPPPSARMACQR